MINLVEIPIENELDLALAYRKSMKVGELIKISVSMRTAFATAVSEVCRELADKTEDGLLSISTVLESGRYILQAKFSYKEVNGVDSLEEGLRYASKLVPHFEHEVCDGLGTIVFKLKIPQAASLNQSKIMNIQMYFENEELITPYENLRRKNVELYKINEQSATALRTAEYIIEQKNEFLSVASHELKTPMTILLALIQLAVKKANEAQSAVLLPKIEAQAVKMRNMISQLLDVSQSDLTNQKYQFETLEINAYLKDLHDLIANLIPMHEFQLILADKPGYFRGDRLRLEQVINNLVGNASKYSANHSKITLKAVVAENEIMLCVQDEGIGMSLEDIKYIFEKFYRVSAVTNRVAGLGIGLYLSARIVMEHRGKIWVESELGKGSTFFVSIPITS